MKHFNLSQPPKPKMPYGYYTPLLRLEEKSTKKRALEAPVEASLKLPEADKPVSVTTIQIKNNPQVAPASNKSTLLIFGATVIAATAALVLLSDEPEKKFGQGLTHLGHFAESAGASIIDGLSHLSTSFFGDSNYKTPFPSEEVLQPTVVTDQNVESIAMREKYPTYYPAAGALIPALKVVGDKVTSAFGKTILLSAAEGEPLRQLLPFCNDGWCSTKNINKEAIADQFKLKTYEEFTRYSKPEKEEERQRALKMYERYKKDFYDTLPARKTLYEGIPKDALNGWFKEFESWDDHVQFGYQYQSSSQMEGFDTSDRSSVLRNEYGYKSPNPLYEERAEIMYSTDLEENFIRITKSVRDTHQRGPRKSRWNKFMATCNLAKNAVDCEVNYQPIDHESGELKYNGSEKVVSPDCSIVTEELTVGEKVMKKVYALDPRKHMPYFLSKFLIQSEYNNYKAETPYSKRWAEGSKYSVDAKVTIPTSFPDLPETCEGLRS